MEGVLILSFTFLCCLLSCCTSQRTAHHYRALTSGRVRSIVSCSDAEYLFTYDFPSILKPRVPGTDSHAQVKEYIVSRLQQLNCLRWNVTLHSFEDSTPLGVKPFTNLIATLDPHVDKRLVLAAHYDSKLIPPQDGKEFLGATDSALPVALLLDLALTLDEKLQNREYADYSLQVIFFDGEEAFERWTNTDSLYGSRQLAEELSQRSGLLSTASGSGIDAMDVFVLLDLIGSVSPHPQFHNIYSDTSSLFERFVRIEDRLKKAGHLNSHTANYFDPKLKTWLSIEDDHKPFLNKGVPIVHLITHPFPHAWHTLEDNGDIIDRDMVENFRKILTVFLHEYFGL